jgi:capsular exopolysaccharide synthesis family protein
VTGAKHKGSDSSLIVSPPAPIAPVWRSGFPQSPDILPGEGEGLRHWKAVRKHWLLIAATGSLLAGVLAAGAWFLLAAKYTAFANVYVAAAPPRLVGMPGSENLRNDFLTYQRFQANRIKSRIVLNAALDRDDVKALNLAAREPDPIPWLEDELKVDYKEGSEIITVSMLGHDPRELITLVDAVTQCYVRDVVNVENQQRAEEIAQLENIYNSSKEKLHEKRNLRRRLIDQVGSGDTQALSQKQIVLLSNFGELKKQHINVRFELMKAQGRLAALKNRLKLQPALGMTEKAIDKAVREDPVAREHLARISRLKEIVRDYEMNALSSEESGLRTARKRIEALQHDVEVRRQEIKEQLAGERDHASKEEGEFTLAALSDEVATLTAQEKALAGEVEKATEEIGKIGNSSTEVAMLSDEIRQEEKLTERIGERLETLKFELRAPPRVRIDQPAGLAKRERKRQILATACAPVAAFLCVGLCVSWWEVRARRLQTVHEVTGLGMKLIGAVPRLPAAAQRRLVMGSDEQQVYGPTFLESVDAIRTLLLRGASVDGTRTVMVTSAVEGEAKTTLSSHLAISLARAGRKTLLIDCDLRRPTLHDIFGRPLQPGFSEALMQEVDVMQAVREAVDGLYILAAGQWDREVLRVLAKEGPQHLFDRLKKEFDFIVIDSHPVLAAADSLLIGQYVDAVIFSLLRDRSQLHVVYAACERLAGLGIRVLGAVVNGIDHEALYEDFSHSLPRYPRT